MRRWLLGVVGVLASIAMLGTALPAASAAQTPPIAAFALAAPVAQVPSGLLARAVIANGNPCPTLQVTVAGTSSTVRMAERPRPANTRPAFDAITVCSAPIPPAATRAVVGGHAIPSAMPTQVDRLAMLGDSGCRIESAAVQDCADPDQWPLARVSAAVAADHPDAVIFNGDFFYREAPCPTVDESECGSSPAPVTTMPFTDSAYGWIADVLLPMTPMFGVAPIIVTRGNHEACYRGGNGFFFIMDPREGTSNTCAPSFVDGVLTAAPTLPSTTYAIDLPVTAGRTLRLAIADSAGGSDIAVSSFAPIQRGAYARAAMLAAPRIGRESWLLTHRPVYGYVSTAFATPGRPFNPWTSYDQGAAAWGLLDHFDLVFSSHLHLAEAVQLPGLPGQLILGNAGTLLDRGIGFPLPTEPYTVGTGETYPSPSWAWQRSVFGYALATPNAGAGSWTLDMRDERGRSFARCGLKDARLFCRDR